LFKTKNKRGVVYSLSLKAQLFDFPLGKEKEAVK
jgi:hypothetical protein